MRALQRDTRICATGAANLALTAMDASAALPEPTFNGAVVQDVTQSFTFDRIGTDVEIGSYINKDAYQGTVRSLVIRTADDTLDFYFHIATTTGLLKTGYASRAPAGPRKTPSQGLCKRLGSAWTLMQRGTPIMRRFTFPIAGTASEGSGVGKARSSRRSAQPFPSRRLMR
jgi:hypothetical protein